ncbi:Spermidine/putrescine import ATP-binding protein PotA [bacterium HR32]|nr:Spermidine/putrescine import ATP-binding protein PotA [bacterium HR32]
MEVRVEGLVKRYGRVLALAGVNHVFPSGALTAVVGPSGCGKTTLLRVLAGFVQPEEGRVWMDGRDVTGVPPQARRCALVFQNYALWPHMTVFDNVAFGLRLQRLPASEVERRVREALALVELDRVPGIERRRPKELSGGQQQRVALARALAVRPGLLLLDEPLSNLDAKVRQRVRGEIRTLQRRTGITTVYVTHDQEEALSIADDLVVMDGGRIVQSGRPEEVYAHPEDPFVAEFLGSTNVLNGTVGPDGRILPSSEGRLLFRAEDTALWPAGQSLPPDYAWAPAEVVDCLFLGHVYRAYVRLGDTVVLADTKARVGPGQVVVAVPRDRLLVFSGSEPAARR